MAICVFILVASNSDVTDQSDEFIAVYFSFQGKNDVIRTLNKDKRVYHRPPPHIPTPIMMTSTIITIKSLQLAPRVAIYYKLY